MDEAIALNNVKYYRVTEHHARDRVFNWLIDLYTKKNRLWDGSDEFVFGGFLYYVLDYVGYGILFGVLWWLVGVMQSTKGDWYALFFLIIFVIVRIGMLLSAVRHGNRLVERGGGK